MSERKDRALLHRADSRQRRRLFLIAQGAATVALLVALGGMLNPGMRGVTLEIYKLLLQFCLITAGGGALLTLVGDARERATRRQARAAAVQALDRELDSAYRALKKSKRMLRAHSAMAGAGDPDGAERRIAQPVFEKGMEDFLRAQLELETICEHIWQRDDILDRSRLKRMEAPLHYAARYYHDVHEDFEKGRVRMEDGHYWLGEAVNIDDYLRGGGSRRSRPAGVDEALAIVEDERAGMDRRSAALTDLIAASPAEEAEPGRRAGKIRYADVAGACFDLLSAELAEARARLLV